MGSTCQAECVQGGASRSRIWPLAADSGLTAKPESRATKGAESKAA